MRLILPKSGQVLANRARAPFPNKNFLGGVYPSVRLQRSKSISSFVGKISAMFRQNGSPEDQRIKAEMAARNATIQAPHFRGPGVLDREERVDVTSKFQIGMMSSFIIAAQNGEFPGNRKTELPLWPVDDFKYFTQKYEEWAPSPYREIPNMAAPMGMGTLPGPSPPPFFRFSLAFGGMMDEMFDGVFDHLMTRPGESSHEQITARLSEKHVERSFKLLAEKLWFGLPPMPECHWKANRLDDEDKIEEALSVLQSVVDVFDYWRRPDIQGNLRATHNKVFIELDVFQDAMKALYAEKGEAPPEWSVSKLWQDFVKHQFDFMATQARHYLLNHLLVLHTHWKARLMRAIGNGRQINATQTTIRIDHFALLVLNKIQDLYLSAELLCRPRTDGFLMIYGVHPNFQNIDSPAPQLNAIYARLEEERMNHMKSIYNATIDAQIQARRAEGPMPDFMEPLNMVIDREWGHKRTQPEVENPPKLSMEPWVRQLSQESVEKFGFLIYRLSYGESEEEWAKTKEKVVKRIESGWEGVVGGEAVKRKAVVRWMDGRKVGIAEGDLDGARAHFKSATEPNTPNPIPKNLNLGTCLAITPQSLRSFTQAPPKTPSSSSSPTPQPFPGDFSPFIHIIDKEYTPDPEPSTTSASAPPPSRSAKKNLEGYKGTLLLPMHLVFPELYALKAGAGPVGMLEDLWAIGRSHPWGMYTGPTTGVTRRYWREMGTQGLAGVVVKAASEHAAAKGASGEDGSRE